MGICFLSSEPGLVPLRRLRPVRARIGARIRSMVVGLIAKTSSRAFIDDLMCGNQSGAACCRRLEHIWSLKSQNSFKRPCASNPYFLLGPGAFLGRALRFSSRTACLR